MILTACGNPAAPQTSKTEQTETVPVQGTDPNSETEPDSPAAQTEDAATPFTFTRENFPRLDGSTSTVPLAEAVCAVLLGESRESVADLVQFSKTSQAYRQLLGGYCDLLIVGEPSPEVLEEKEELGFEWVQTPFADDAFVFVVNVDNPVDSITVDQARAIYTGEITNWSELGGEDREILPFQRPDEAGSQSLMEKLVMQGTPMMEPPMGFVASTMEDLMEVVRSYDGSPGAIGYSVYYYAKEMEMAEGLKILAIEGVEPSPETIRDGTYPLRNPKYVVIPANAPEGAPNRILYDWLLGPDGQRLVEEEGYVSVAGGQS
jgi:phosphate transport system substrate-binding protein